MLINDRRSVSGAILFLVAIVVASSNTPASADNSYASSNKGYSGTSYARSAKPQNAGQTMYSSNQSSGPPQLGTSYASGGSYAGTSYARNSAGVPSSHINLGKSTNGSLLNQMRSTAQPVQTNFSRLSTGNGAASNRASMLSVMGRGSSPKTVFVRPASAAGSPIRRPASGKAAVAPQSLPAGNSSAANTPPAGGGVSVLSQIRKRRGG